MAADARALDVRCDYCGALPGEHCYVYDRLIGERWGFRKPHAARLRAAEKAREEKTNE